MATNWEITYNATTKTAEEWGLSVVRRTRRSQAPDVATLTTLRKSSKEAPQFAYDETVTILKNSVRWFEGSVGPISHDAQGGGSQAISYQILGPWHDLNRITYQQLWTTPAGGTYRPRVIFGQSNAGTFVSTGTMMEDIIDFAVARAGRLQKGSVVSGFSFPITEATGVKCGPALQRVMRYHPDAVARFDYSTSPPTLNIVPRAGLSTYSIPLTSCFQKSVREMPELQVPYVRIVYEVTDTLDGQTFVSEEVDQYPGSPSTDIGAIHAIVPLLGKTATRETQRVKTREIPESEDSEGFSRDSQWLDKAKSFWKAHYPALEVVDDADLRIKTGSHLITLAERGADPPFAELDDEDEPIPDPTPSLDDLPRELVEGQLPAWETNLNAGRIVVSAVLGYRGANPTHDSVTDLFPTPHPDAGVRTPCREISVELLATDAISKNYSNSTLELGQEPPTGVAQAIHDALAVLQFEGSVVTKEKDPSDNFDIGTLLNISEGKASWASMNALVQSVTDDVESGETTAEFGPPGHLSISDLIELDRIFKVAPVSYSTLKERTEGQSESGSGQTPYRQLRSNTTTGTGNTFPFKITCRKDLDDDSYHAYVAAGAVVTNSTETNKPKVLIPQIDSTAISDDNCPGLDVEGTRKIFFKITKDADGFVVDPIEIEAAASLPSDETSPTVEYVEIGEVNAAGDRPGGSNVIGGTLYWPGGPKGARIWVDCDAVEQGRIEWDGGRITTTGELSMVLGNCCECDSSGEGEGP